MNYPVRPVMNNPYMMQPGMMQPGMQQGMQWMPGMQQGMPFPPQNAASGDMITPSGNVFPPPSNEQSYIENILRMNLGKIGTFYMTYENNSQWNAKIFKGILEGAGRDHIIISDPSTGMRYLLLMINFNYATFDEPLNYTYPGVIGNPPPKKPR